MSKVGAIVCDFNADRSPLICRWECLNVFGEGLGFLWVGWKECSEAGKNQIVWVADGYGYGDNVVWLV